jgi:VIT1/CCC1 family predicted Fe2+/Mn2+ transporter
MPSSPHTESHFTAPEVVRDIVIGMSDGLTVPFALAAGLTGAVASSRIVMVAGLAEIAAGSIAMGLGGYLAARTDYEHYHSERRREVLETQELPDVERQELVHVFRGYGLNDTDIQPVVAAICSDRERWVDFMMRFELGLEQPEAGRAFRSAATIACSYIAGGLIPLSPYMFTTLAGAALYWSVLVTLAALVVFGFVKGKFTGLKPVRSALQTAAIGGLAAAAAFAIARLIG